MINLRTDMAVELHDNCVKNGIISEGQGVVYNSKTDNDITVSRVLITNKEGEKIIGKPVGNYITIDAPYIKRRDDDYFSGVTDVFTKELNDIAKIQKSDTVLVVGLGNRNITPDALGPKTVDSILISRHLIQYIPDKIDKRINSLCAISPGVLGITGIETNDIVFAVADKIKPSVVIVIDALASLSVKRICSSIQICDTGISPGSGVNNARKPINKETLGCRVISVGVPMVVGAATIINEAIEYLGNKTEDGIFEKAVNSILYPFGNEIMVTPKEIDVMLDDLSKIIANGINLSVHKGMTTEEIGFYI